MGCTGKKGRWESSWIGAVNEEQQSVDGHGSLGGAVLYTCRNLGLELKRKRNLGYSDALLGLTGISPLSERNPWPKYP